MFNVQENLSIFFSISIPLYTHTHTHFLIEILTNYETIAKSLRFSIR